MLKDLQKFVKAHHLLALLGLLILSVFIMQYSNRKGSVFDKMGNINRGTPSTTNATSGSFAPALPAGQNESYSQVVGMAGPSGAAGLAPGSSQPIINPEDLLPRDNNSQWAQLNPSGNGDLNNVNLLQAGYLNGINTVGSSMRNANLQIRSEDPNPQNQVSPWLNTTIEPDLMRRPLEIGSAR